jgi:hypothetical protein
MSPKEKAEELVDKFLEYTPAEEKYEYPYAIQCALIAVDEMLNSFYNVFDDSVVESSKVGGYRNMKDYWGEVKTEILKLTEVTNE